MTDGESEPQRGVREVTRSLDNIEATALEAHQSLDSIAAWAVSTMDYLEHECEYAELELESPGLVNEIVHLMVLVHTLHRRLTEPRGFATVAPWLIDAENEPRD